ncbi:MAG: hypothetical protein KAS32_11180, partial [Candidatus Peribacteraceae bacterium]|nr:hypothetical protein [Candidatus Peribacteraceae bacterium]
GVPFVDNPNMVVGGALSEVLEQKRLVLDNQTGLFDYYTQWDRNKRRSIKGFKTNNRQELWELRQFLHYLKGQQVAFYIPTFSKDLVPIQTLANASAVMNISNIGYNKHAREREPKVDIRIWLTNGTLLERTIVDSSIISSTEEQLTVDTTWPYDIEPEEIERIEFIEKVRINVDDIIITHYNALGISKTFIPTKEVFD